MPTTVKTFGEIVKLGDLPAEEKEQIRDSIIYSAEHEGEFYSEVNKAPLDENKTSMTFVRSYLPKIDKTSDRYKNGLVEGVTPDPEQINEAEFTVTVTEIGWYYRFTNKALKHSYRSVKERCSKFLQNLFKTYHDEKIADAYLSSANIVTSIDLLKLEDLLTLNTILYKNGAVAFGEYYKLKVAPEVADKMLIAYKDLITHTTQKEAIVKGEIGEIGGFRVIKSRLQAFQVVNGKYPFVAYGQTAKGEYPVSIAAYDDDLNGEIIYKKLGSNGHDELNQRGSIGLYLDGHGFYVYDDSICVTGTCTITGLKAITEMDNSKRSNLVSTTIAASNLYPNVTVFELAPKATHTLSVTDEKGTKIAADALTYESTNTDVATVSTAGVVTGVKQGTSRIVISKGDKVNVVTVKVTTA